MNSPELQVEKYLLLSVEQYRDLLQHAKDVLQVIDSCDYSQIDEQVLKLRELQAAAAKNDEELLPLLQADLPTWKKDRRYQMRTNYINSILEINESLVPKIRSIMAVTSAELKKMHSGRTALAGYSSQKSRQRSLRGIG